MSVSSPYGADAAPHSTFGTLLRVAATGLVVGGAGYGAVIGVAHLVHSGIASLRNAVVLGLWTFALYGAWCAAALAVGGLVALVDRRRRATERSPLARRALVTGLFLFNASWWLGALLHGFTYDHVPVERLRTLPGMLAVLTVATLAILGVALVVSRLLARPLERLVAGSLRRQLTVTGIAAALALAAHAAVAIVVSLQAPPVAPSAGSVPVADTGLRVILVGLDGADWRVAEPLMAEGELPHFKALVEGGTSASLATFPDSNSAVIWASIYSGRSPDEHRVLDFYRIRLAGMSSGVYPVHRTYFKELADQLVPLGLAVRDMVSRGTMAVRPIWEIVDRFGISTGVVDGYFYSFPAMAPRTPGGYVLSYGLDGFVAQLRDGSVPELAGRTDLFVQPPTLLPEIEPFLTGGDFDWQAASLRHLLATHPQPRFLNFYTHEPDTVQHLEWKFFQPQFFPFAGADAARADRIPERYRAFDALLGDLMARVDERTVLLVVSDHGHSPTILHHRFYTQHRHGPPGIFIAYGGPVRRGVRLTAAHVYDIFPTILRLYGLPRPADANGHPLDEMLDPAWLDAHPLASIASYEGLWQDRGPGETSSGLEEAEIAKLRALGYL